MMKSVNLAGMSALALMLTACGGGSDEPVAGEEATAPAVEEIAVVEESAEPAAEETEAAEADVQETAAAEEPAAAPAPAPAPVAQAPVGFAMCKACHSVEPGKHGIGPSLAGVFGHEAGEVEGFQFSTAMKNSGLKLDEAGLDKYLENPMKVVPGTKMSYAGLKDATKRKEVIEYLKTL